MLTHRQRDLLIYVDRELKETGVCPSYREICVSMGLTSTSGIHRLVIGLEERGFIRRLPDRARAMEVVRMPSDVEVAADAA